MLAVAQLMPEAKTNCSITAIPDTGEDELVHFLWRPFADYLTIEKKLLIRIQGVSPSSDPLIYVLSGSS